MVGIKQQVICPGCGDFVEPKHVRFVDESNRPETADRVLQYPVFKCRNCGYNQGC